MKRIFTMLLFSSLVSVVSAEEIRSVMVWHDSDRAPVKDDHRFGSNPQGQINEDLKAQGLTFGSDMRRNRDRTQEALGAYMSTSAFEAAEQSLKAFGYGLSAAMQYRIERVPSILVNDRYLVVGVNSLDEAVSIFHREVD
jgi:hypothetical protein